MDVRCEKCQTEYELDEARLKPGGVTVKCTHCGHMFKIRKRSTTNVGAPPADRARTPSAKPAGPAHRRADSLLDEETAVRPPEATAEERHWLIRLENGEQKSCRELAMLQQWIIAGVVTRESLISRSGKTWKRLGDITELAQYFTIADDAVSTRDHKPTTEHKPVTKAKVAPGTLMGFGVTAAGGTILPDDDEMRSTGNFRARPKTSPPSPPPAKRPAGPSTPPLGSNANALEPTPAPAAMPRPPTQPPPVPRRAPSIPASNRSTGAWVSGTPEGEANSPESRPFSGRVKPSASQEPAFAGTVRVAPGDEASFVTGKIQTIDDDDDHDDVLPRRRGSRGGLLLLFLAVLVMGAAAGAIYVFVIKKQAPAVTTAAVPADAPDAIADTALVVTPVIDAAIASTVVDAARAELGADIEARLRSALTALEGSDDPVGDAMRVQLAAAIAQGLLDRAAISADKSEAEQLKKTAKQLVLDVTSAAQRAHKAAPTDATSNLAMALVLRLQGKSTREIKRYLDAARAEPTWAADVALAEALAFVRDGKLADAKSALEALDQGEAAMEASGDVRARFQRARIAYAMEQSAEASTFVAQVLAAQPDHAAARALAARIETTVAKTDPLPPEDPGTSNNNSGGNNSGGGGNNTTNNSGGGADTYDRLLARANTAAERNCSQALELYSKALEQKPNGVEALTGMGYCHIDAKQFASAFSKFRAALAVSSRYEPALWGVGEAYQQQGLKEQAIEAFRKYLEVYPRTAKAQKALDRLGAGASDPPAGGSASGQAPPPDAGGGGGGDPTPTPTPTPAPTPTAPATDE